MDKKTKNDLTVIIGIAILGISGLIYIIILAIIANHQTADRMLTAELDNNRTIFCGVFLAPVSKAAGYKVQGERVFGHNESWDMSQSCISR